MSLVHFLLVQSILAITFLSSKTAAFSFHSQHLFKIARSQRCPGVSQNPAQFARCEREKQGGFDKEAFRYFRAKTESRHDRQRVRLSLRENETDEKITLFPRFWKNVVGAIACVTLSLSLFSSSPGPVHAADTADVGFCLLKQCRLELAECIANPKCLANVICINSCVGKPDEGGCQIKCGDIFENDVVGKFNKCAVSDKNCVPQREDDGSYPVPPKSNTVQKFDTSLFNGRWYITAGQNELFDIFPCQVHFFTNTAPGKFYGKLNWRIEEPDGEFFTRDALQEFVQDPDWPAHLINHDNEYLHYKDDWYVLDYAVDGNEEGVPPFALIFYRGSNDAWDGYGGAVVYTRDSKLPESLVPRLSEAVKKVNFEFERDFKRTDNTCSTLDKDEIILLREKFAGKVAIQTEKQLQQQAVIARNAAVNSVKAQKLYFSNELGQVENAVKDLAEKAEEFEQEIVKDAVTLEKRIVGQER